MKFKALAAGLILALANPVLAGVVTPQPFQIGAETARFDRGVPTVMLEQRNGAVQISPLPMDHGSVAFSVIVFNDSDHDANFGVENVTATVGDTRLTAFTADQLTSKAKNRAMWSAIGVAVLAGASAAVASQAYTTNRYSSTLRTPRGTYRYTASYRDNSLGVLGAGASTAAGVAGIQSIQDQLDYTLSRIGNEVVQTTTVDSNESYGGRVVLAKIANQKQARDIVLNIEWNGEIYKFGLHIPRKGDSAITPMRSATGPLRSPKAVAGPLPNPAPPLALTASEITTPSSNQTPLLVAQTLLASTTAKPTPSAVPSTAPQSSGNITDALIRLSQLRSDGLLTNAAYEAQRADLLKQ